MTCVLIVGCAGPRVAKVAEAPTPEQAQDIIRPPPRMAHGAAAETRPARDPERGLAAGGGHGDDFHDQTISMMSPYLASAVSLVNRRMGSARLWATSMRSNGSR